MPSPHWMDILRDETYRVRVSAPCNVNLTQETKIRHWCFYRIIRYAKHSDAYQTLSIVARRFPLSFFSLFLSLDLWTFDACDESVHAVTERCIYDRQCTLHETRNRSCACGRPPRLPSSLFPSRYIRAFVRPLFALLTYLPVPTPDADTVLTSSIVGDGDLQFETNPPRVVRMALSLFLSFSLLSLSLLLNLSSTACMPAFLSSADAASSKTKSREPAGCLIADETNANSVFLRIFRIAKKRNISGHNFVIVSLSKHRSYIALHYLSCYELSRARARVTYVSWMTLRSLLSLSLHSRARILTSKFIFLISLFHHLFFQYLLRGGKYYWSCFFFFFFWLSRLLFLFNSRTGLSI